MVIEELEEKADRELLQHNFRRRPDSCTHGHNVVVPEVSGVAVAVQVGAQSFSAFNISGRLVGGVFLLNRRISRTIFRNRRLNRFLRWANSVFRLVPLYCRPVVVLSTLKLISLTSEGTPKRSIRRMKFG